MTKCTSLSDTDVPSTGAHARVFDVSERRPRVLNKKTDIIPPNAKYIGRPSNLGNPFVIGRHGTRPDVIRQHQEWLPTQPKLMASLHLLGGCDLVCWCAPRACHGHTYLYLANPGLRDAAFWPQDLWLYVEPLALLATDLDEGKFNAYG